jgi:hypothetical protein
MKIEENRKGEERRRPRSEERYNVERDVIIFEKSSMEKNMSKTMLRSLATKSVPTSTMSRTSILAIYAMIR